MNKSSTENDIIKLNIGGFRYQTTRSTLTKIPDTYFSGLLGGRIPTIIKDEEIFIDRDGQFFGPILTFLRTTQISIPTQCSIEDVKREASFFAIKPLIEGLEQVSIEKLSLQEKENDTKEEALMEEDAWSRYVIKYLKKNERSILDAISDQRNRKGLLSFTIHVRHKISEDISDIPPRFEGDSFWITLLYFSDRLLELFAEHFASIGLSGYVTYKDKGCPKDCSGELHLDLIKGKNVTRNLKRSSREDVLFWFGYSTVPH